MRNMTEIQDASIRLTIEHKSQQDLRGDVRIFKLWSHTIQLSIISSKLLSIRYNI